MINSVRQTVLAILNKNNFGYLGVSDFNQYAKQAQLEIFENYLSKFNKQINLENVRQSGAGYAGLSQKIAEDLENFSVTNFLTPYSGNEFYLPSLTTTGDNWFYMSKVLCYPTELANGTNTSVVASQLVNTSGNFVSLGVAIGDIVINQATSAIATVTEVTSSTVLTLSANIFPLSATVYMILDASGVKEAEKVSHTKITQLNSSLLTTPNNTFPSYTLAGSTITIYPSTINDKGKVQAQYFRYPLDPKWTYVTFSGGEPIFDASASDYQDIELPIEEENNLILKILKLAGVEIREADIYQYANQEDIKEETK